MNKISVSKISSYEECPKKYQFREARTPEPPVAILMLGSAVHYGVESFVKAAMSGRRYTADVAGEVAGTEFRKLIDKAGGPEAVQWAKDDRTGWVDTFENAARDAHAMASLWVEKVGMVDTWISSEESMGLPLFPEDSVRLTGRLDLRTADGIVVEVKTGSSAWPKGGEDLKAQGAAYPLLVGLTEKPVRLRFDVILRNVKAKTKGPTYTIDQRGPVEVSVARQLSYLEDARQHYQGIAQGLFPRRIGQHCGYCSFRSVCF